MPDISYEFLTRFFEEHLPFLPTPRQVADFQSDLALVSPFLMEAALVEVKNGTQGYLLVYRPDEWRPAIFKVYNRKVAEHAQLFPLLHCFETAFRSTTAVTLEAYYGHRRWWAGVYTAIQAGRHPKSVTLVGRTPMTSRVAFLISKIIADIDGDGRRNIVPGIQNGYEFMEHCDLSHIKRLVEEHWNVFGPKFAAPLPPLTLADFTAKFTRVQEARNDVYHHKSVARMTKVVESAEDLLDRLNFSLRFVYEKICTCKAVPPAFTIAIEPRHRTWIEDAAARPTIASGSV
jgi:hypothetical protein